jgi:hypothetical protein
MTDHQEVLGPRLTKGEARPLETQAKRHYRAAGRNLARFAADLRRLQDGEAHLTRGFSSFGAYAEHTFDGLSAANAKKISIQGAVLLALEEHDRISLDEQTSQLPGATGLRALAVVLSQHGEDAMLAIYDKASQLRPGRAVVDSTVNLAVHGLLASPPALDAPRRGSRALTARGREDARRRGRRPGARPGRGRRSPRRPRSRARTA